METILLPMTSTSNSQPKLQKGHTVFLVCNLNGPGFSVAGFITIAPVGHASAHNPHEIHSVSRRDLSRAGRTIVLNPLFTSPKIDNPTTSLHMRIHLEQEIHLFGSNVIYG